VGVVYVHVGVDVFDVVADFDCFVE